MTARSEREQRLIEELELPERLEEQLDALLPADLIDVRLLASRLDVAPGFLLGRWRDEAERGELVPQVHELTPRQRRVSLAEFRRWWRGRDLRLQDAARLARARQARAGLKPRARRRQGQDQELESAMRELRSFGGRGR